MMRRVFMCGCAAALLLCCAVSAMADYPGCVVNEGNSIVDGRLISTFDDDYYAFTVRPHETVCFSVLQEGGYVARTSEGFDLGTLSVDSDEPFDFHGKKVYWMVEID